MEQIWNDPEIADIFIDEDGQPKLLLGDLWWNDDQNLVVRATEADWKADPTNPSPEDFVYACETGIAAFERLSHYAAAGWKRFLLHITGVNTMLLSPLSRQLPEVALFAEWVVVTCRDLGAKDQPEAKALNEVMEQCERMLVEAGRSSVDISGDGARALVADRLPPNKDFPEPVSYNHLELAESKITELRHTLESMGVEVLPVDVGEVGRALAARLDDNFATVVHSARGSKPGLAYVVGGVAHHIMAPSERVLAACNTKNLEERVMTCTYYPDANAGSVVMRVAIWPNALTAIPDLFKAVVEEVTWGAAACSKDFHGQGITGQPFRFVEEDIVELATICCV